MLAALSSSIRKSPERKQAGLAGERNQNRSKWFPPANNVKAIEVIFAHGSVASRAFGQSYLGKETLSPGSKLQVWMNQRDLGQAILAEYQSEE
jgi:hypothetical protein